MNYSIVIPTYNGGSVLFDLIHRLINVLSDKSQFEIILIFDGGKEKTRHIVEQIRQNNPHLVRVFHLSRNYGQHKATGFGFTMAHGDFIITMDEDLQHTPESIKYLISRQKKGDYDVVYGKFTRLKHNRTRNFISGLLRKFLLKYIPHLHADYSSFRLIKRETALKSSSAQGSYFFIDDYLSRNSANISSVEVDHNPRITGESSYTPAKLLKHAILLLLAFTRILSWLIFSGFLLTGTGLFIKISYSGFRDSVTEIFSALTLSGIFLILTGLLGIFVKYLTMKKNSTEIIFSE